MHVHGRIPFRGVHLQHQVRVRQQGPHIGFDGGACFPVGLIGDEGGHPGPGLDGHGEASLDELLDGLRHQGDPSLLGAELAGDGQFHGNLRGGCLVG